MYQRCGFTLIELLVVVLIIGILSAVALPQYQKAVEKSRSASALSLIVPVAQGAQMYHLSNGTWPTRFDELDISVPYPKLSDTEFSDGEWKLTLIRSTANQNGRGAAVSIKREKGRYQGHGFYYFLEVDRAGLQGLYCVGGWKDNAYCEKVMQLQNGTFLHGWAGWNQNTVYPL